MDQNEIRLIWNPVAMKESMLQSKVTKYLLRTNHHLRFSFPYELKIKNNNKPLNLKSDLRPQQVPAMIRARKNKLHKKLTDLDPSLKPCDAMFYYKSPSFIAVCWYTPRKPKLIYWMNPIKVNEAIEQGIKSIKQDEAFNYTEYVSIIPN